MNCKLKRDAATHLIEWLTSEARTSPKSVKGVAPQKPSFIRGSVAKWYIALKDHLTIAYNTKYIFTI